MKENPMARLKGSKSRPVIALDDACHIVDLCSFAGMNEDSGFFIAKGLTPDQVREEIRQKKEAELGPIGQATQMLKLKHDMELVEQKLKAVDDPNYIAIQRANLKGEIERLQRQEQYLQRSFDLANNAKEEE
jgi:hypothetical protein